MKNWAIPLSEEENKWARALGPAHYVLDYSQADFTNADVLKYILGRGSVDRQRVNDINADQHLEYVNEKTSLRYIKNLFRLQTVVLVGSGPSAAGISERLKPFRGHVKVAALNKALEWVEDPDFACLYERMSMREWWEDTDPSKVTLLTSPVCNFEVLKKWQGENTFYSWTAELNRTEGWECLDPLIGAGTTASLALHALVQLGFKDILLVGVDFAGEQIHSDDPKTTKVKFYGDGTTVGDTWAKGHPFVKKLGINDRPMWSNPALHNNCLAMEVCCSIAEDCGVSVVNCSGQGFLDIATGILEEELSIATCGVLDND